MKLSQQNNSEDELLSEINIIPLVDVMLVLLIIFMVAAPLSLSGINVNLPKSKASSKGMAEEKIVLSISKDGKFFMDKSEIKEINLDEKLKAIFQYKSQKELFIRADKDVAYGRVIDAMASAKMAGVNKISMLTEYHAKGGKAL